MPRWLVLRGLTWLWGGEFTAEQNFFMEETRAVSKERSNIRQKHKVAPPWKQTKTRFSSSASCSRGGELTGMVVWGERREDGGAARVSAARLSNARVRHEVAGEEGNRRPPFLLELARRRLLSCPNSHFCLWDTGGVWDLQPRCVVGKKKSVCRTIEGWFAFSYLRFSEAPITQSIM